MPEDQDPMRTWVDLFIVLTIVAVLLVVIYGPVK